MSHAESNESRTAMSSNYGVRAYNVYQSFWTRRWLVYEEVSVDMYHCISWVATFRSRKEACSFALGLGTRWKLPVYIHKPKWVRLPIHGDINET